MKRLYSIVFASSNIYFFVGILIVFVNLLWFIPTITRMRSQISENELEIVRRGQSETRAFLQNQITNLTSSASFLKPDLKDPSNKAVVEKVLATNPHFGKAVLIDKSGQELFRVDRVSTSLGKDMINWAGQPELEVVLKSGNPFFGDIWFTDALEPVTVVAIPVSFISNETEGILLADLYIRTLFNNIDSIRSASDGHVYVVDKDGTLIAHRDPALVLKQTNRSEYKIVQDVLSKKKELVVSDDDTYTYENENGSKVLATGGLIDETGWALIFEESKDLITAPIQRIKLFAIATIFLGFIGVLLLYKFNKRVLDAKNTAEMALTKSQQLANELERMNKLMVDRELKMIELKQKISELETK